MPPAVVGGGALSDSAVTRRAAALDYRHAGCLHVRLRADVDLSSAEGISSRRSRGDNTVKVGFSVRGQS